MQPWIRPACRDYYMQRLLHCFNRQVMYNEVAPMTKPKEWRGVRPRVVACLRLGLMAFLLFPLVSSLTAQPISTNRVLELDGTGGYVELPPNVFNDLDEATVEAWVRWDDFSGTGKRLFNYGDALRDMSLFSGYDSTTLRFVVADPSGKREDLHLVLAEGFLRPQQWCHVAGVSGKGGMKLYLDGALVGTNAYTGSFSAFTNGTRNYLGQTVTTNDPPANFKGALDEVRVWRVARTAEQIQQTMLQRLTGREEGLAALWNFDDVADGVVKDSGPGAHHGKLIGSAKAVAGDTPASHAPTRVSKVLELDGKDSYVQLPDNIFHSFTEGTVRGVGELGLFSGRRIFPKVVQFRRAVS